MYEENAGFDQTGAGLMVQPDEDGFSQTHLQNCNTNPNFSIGEQSNYSHQTQQEAAISAMEMELQNQLNMEMEHYNNQNSTNNEIQQIVQEMSMNSFNGDYAQNGHFTNIFPLPKYSSPSNLLPNPSITFSNSTHQKSSSFLASLGLFGDLNNPTADIGPSGPVYDPLLPLNLPPQPPLLRDLFHSLPHGGYNTVGAGGSRNNGSLFNGVEESEIGSVGAFYQNGENGVFEFTAGEMNCLGKNRDGKDTKHFATERHRRVLLNDKFQALRKMLANPSKNDRASIVGDAIVYINELKRSVAELKLLVEKKRCARERLKRLRTENHDDANNELGNNESKSLVDIDHPCNGSTLRSSWLHRKSKNTEVDVRIIDDEVTVKLVQQKRINCLLFVSKVLDELQLDLHHVAGGLIGDYYSFLFNSKICEGSIVYASAIANKLIEVVDKHYAAIPPSNSY
ncbi:hypothetical protein CASFOL_041104 [Castilleja foliolosa]|uniref:BHLH domain-containing protein n=1 Tax=Castilleja foliolosa TaxID=1961234 RepID=A0ABD3BDH2_9LAMI